MQRNESRRPKVSFDEPSALGSEQHLITHVKPDPNVVEQILRSLESSRINVLLDEPASNEAINHLRLRLSQQDSQPGLFVQTSGTTDEPKFVFVPGERLWDSTNPTQEVRTWGLTFPPHKMAGLQVIAQVIASDGILVAPETNLPPLQKLEEFERAGVEAISATPTFWRMARGYRGPLEDSLRVITLGGEIADQRVLDDLCRKYRNARISHVYASSEAGSVFSVTDGLAGFPANYVGKVFRNGKSISVSGGQILVHFPLSGDNPLRTGDFVVLNEGRYLFDGRSGSHINVNGKKVSLSEVERIAMRFDGILDCKASGIQNPFSGQSVLLQVIWSSEARLNELNAHLRNSLPRVSVPALVESVQEFGINESQKKVM